MKAGMNIWCPNSESQIPANLLVMHFEKWDNMTFGSSSDVDANSVSYHEDATPEVRERSSDACLRRKQGVFFREVAEYDYSCLLTEVPHKGTEKNTFLFRPSHHVLRGQSLRPSAL